MITKEQVQEKIGKLQIEAAELETLHQSLVNDFQQKQAQFQQVVAGNQNRFQQITGAIAQLKELMNGLEPPQNDTPAA